MFSAGEARLTDVGKTSGVHVRVIGFWESPFGSGKRDFVIKVNRVSEKHYGLAGYTVLNNYLRYRDVALPNLKRMQMEMSERLADVVDDDMGKRLAYAFGAIYAAGELANSVLGLEWDVEHIVVEAFRLAVNNRPPSIAQEAIELVGQWIASNRARFEGNSTGVVADELYGRIFPSKDNGEEQIGIIPSALKQLLKENNYLYESVIQQWRENEWLAFDEGRCNKKVRFNNSTIYMVVLNRKGIAAGGGTDNDATVGVGEPEQ